MNEIDINSLKVSRRSVFNNGLQYTDEYLTEQDKIDIYSELFKKEYEPVYRNGISEPEPDRKIHWNETFERRA